MAGFGVATDFPEQLHVINDSKSGLRGIIAIHSTVLGPAAGGCRLWSYDDQVDLVRDAVRLARGMSYKNALAGLPFGGGKAVLLLPDRDFDREAAFLAFGEAVQELSGRYITAEDVGTTVQDMRIVRTRSSYVAGLDSKAGLAGGDPSPWTALGVFLSMKAACQQMLGFDLKGATVAVQGVGNVGAGLCRLLKREGAHLVIADINRARASALASELGARMVGIDDILKVQAEVYAPCALGGVINSRTIPSLAASLICGGANNQLETDEDGENLRKRGVLYAPDYVVNAGGIINVAAEYLGHSVEQAELQVGMIAERLVAILHGAIESGQPTNLVADTLARTMIGSANRAAA